MIINATEMKEFKELLRLEDSELRKATCPYCGKPFTFDSHFTRKEVAEIKVTGGLGTNYDDDHVACKECAKRIQAVYDRHGEHYTIRNRENGEAVGEEYYHLDDAEKALAEMENPERYEIFDNYTGKIAG